DSIFGDGSRLPAAARKEYRFLAPSDPSAEWKRVAGEAATGKLGDALRLFQNWTAQRADDPAGWFDLGLVQAWLGDNAPAVEALGKYVELEPDEVKAGEAWALAEVLR